MTDRTTIGSRPLLVAIAVSIALGATSFAMLDARPDAAASGAALTSWFQEHGSRVRWAISILTLSALPSAIVFALLRAVLPPPHRDVFLIGAIGTIAVTSVQTWTWLGLALHPDHLDPGTARTVLDVAIFWGPVLTGSTVTMMAAPTWLALRAEAGLPRWLGVVGLVACGEQLVETITIFGSSGFTEPGGAMNLQLGAALVSIWLVAFAVWAGLYGRFQRVPAP
jgi:hypothetical protein